MLLIWSRKVWCVVNLNHKKKLGATELPVVDIPGQMDLFGPGVENKTESASPARLINGAELQGGVSAVVPAESLLNQIQHSSVYEVFGVEEPSDKLYFRFDSIPGALADNDSWLSMLINPKVDKCGFDKKPICEDGMPARWSQGEYRKTLPEVRVWVERGRVDGFAYAMEAQDGLVCIDLDDCIVDGQLTPFAAEVIRLCNPTYIELSLSRRGLHIFCNGKLPFLGSQKVITLNGVEGEVEMYAGKRLITMTGLTAKGWDSLQLNQDAVDALAALMKPPRDAVEHAAPGKSYDPPKELKRLKSALERVSPKSYWVWMLVGMALSRYAEEHGCWNEVWELFDWWSQREGNYNAKENRWHWDNFDTGASDDPVTIGSIYYMAKENGWVFDNRKLSSTENGKKGGRPEAAAHADAAERFFNEEVVDPESGQPTLRYHRECWRVYSKVDGWKSIGRDEVVTRLTTFMQNNEDLRPLSSNHYNNSVITNLQSHNYCGTETGMPSWTDTSTRQLKQKIDTFVRNHNKNAQPFEWTATADSILNKLGRLCGNINGTAH
ncbi:hypothetical protein PDESU_03720 [Pontiella desulfatans]|uniref:Primase C-terminal 2 domain-containing protein n=1 Tax=Pontiella desulfatans TaxID=2750659 RepID=A0A6C2U5M0_PONDE|nr:hypothetical protein PDESU_03720 [Pontiella desulfatans]